MLSDDEIDILESIFNTWNIRDSADPFWKPG